jgi:CHC2-type zinc finger protein
MVASHSITTPQPLRVNKTVLHFDKSRLPLAPGFWEDQFGQLRWNRSGWAVTRCIFHASKSGKSFSVQRDGRFHCFGCDAKGRGLIDFVMLRDHCDFKTAARRLRAWDEVGQPSPPLVMVPVRYLTFDYDIDGLHYRASVKDEPRNYAVVRRFCRESADQLTAVGLEQSESADCETYWTRMALGLDELREIGLL